MKRALIVAVLLLPVSVFSAELGRLFLSPTERGAIDAARQGSADVRHAKAALPDDEQQTADIAIPAPPAEPVTVNGYIARSAGAATVWVNGQDAAPGKLSPPGRDGRRVNVPVGHSGAQVALKPGQSFDPGSRQVSDAYQQRPPAQP